jgi:hypothetical protein
MNAGPKHPEVKLELCGQDGNAYSILGRAQRAAKRAGLPKAEWQAFHKQATSGDYDNLLRTCMEWFSCDVDEEDDDDSDV